MRTVRVLDGGTGRVLLGRVRVATTVWESTRGLLGRPVLNEDEGLWLPGCRMIHMFGMRVPIDAVFLDGSGVVRKCVAGLRPWRVAGCWSAASVLELRDGMIGRLGLRAGTILLEAPMETGDER